MEYHPTYYGSSINSASSIATVDSGGSGDNDNNNTKNKNNERLMLLQDRVPGTGVTMYYHSHPHHGHDHDRRAGTNSRSSSRSTSRNRNGRSRSNSMDADYDDHDDDDGSSSFVSQLLSGSYSSSIRSTQSTLTSPPLPSTKVSSSSFHRRGRSDGSFGGGTGSGGTGGSGSFVDPLLKMIWNRTTSTSSNNGSGNARGSDEGQPDEQYPASNNNNDDEDDDRLLLFVSPTSDISTTTSSAAAISSEQQQQSLLQVKHLNDEKNHNHNQNQNNATSTDASTSSLQLLWLQHEEEQDENRKYYSDPKFDGDDTNVNHEVDPHESMVIYYDDMDDEDYNNNHSLHYSHKNDTHHHQQQQQHHQQQYLDQRQPLIPVPVVSSSSSPYFQSHNHPNSYQNYHTYHNNHNGSNSPTTDNHYGDNDCNNGDDDDEWSYQRGKVHSIRLHQATVIGAASRRQRVIQQRCIVLLLVVLVAVVVVAATAAVTATTKMYPWKKNHSTEYDGDKDNNITVSIDLGNDTIGSVDNVDDVVVQSQVKPTELSSMTMTGTTTSLTTGKMNDDDDDDDDDDDRRTKILTALKNLDEEIDGDIVLMSNKTKFIVASQIWQSFDSTKNNVMVDDNNLKSSWSPSTSQQQHSQQQQQQRPRPPLAVVEVSSSKDVGIALPILSGLQRDYNIPFRVRSGGHTFSTDYTTIGDGIVLSLRKLNGISSISNRSRSNDVESNDNNNSNNGINEDNVTSQQQQSLTTRIRTGTRPELSSAEFDENKTSYTVTIEPGVTMEQFMSEVLYEHGYVGIVPSAAHVGMGGFVLGGGYGINSRLHGLAIDNIVQIDAVLVNGTQVTTNHKTNRDLFWALRGAGGSNFAVITSIEYNVYPSNDIQLCASMKLRLDELSGFLRRLGDMEPNLAREFTVSIEGYRPPDNSTSPDIESKRTDTIYTTTPHTKQRLVELNYSFIGSTLVDPPNGIKDDDDDSGFVDVKMYWTGEDNPSKQIGMKYIKTKVAPVLLNGTSTKISDIVYYYFSWSGMSRAEEQDPKWTSVSSAQSWNGFLLPRNNTDTVWTDILSSFEAMLRYCDYVTPKISLWGGAISDRMSNETAFPYRSALYSVGVELLIPDGTTKSTRDEVELINAIWPSVSRHLSGVYVNQQMSSLTSGEGSDCNDYAHEYWGSNLNQLMVLKQKYDPYHSLMHQQSIPIVNATAK